MQLHECLTISSVSTNTQPHKSHYESRMNGRMSRVTLLRNLILVWCQVPLSDVSARGLMCVCCPGVSITGIITRDGCRLVRDNTHNPPGMGNNDETLKTPVTLSKSKSKFRLLTLDLSLLDVDWGRGIGTQTCQQLKISDEVCHQSQLYLKTRKDHQEIIGIEEDPVRNWLDWFLHKDTHEDNKTSLDDVTIH